MRRHMCLASAILGVAAIAVVPAAPAQATVHEIVAQWCSGHEELGPPGISGGSSADNFARPLSASGFTSDAPVSFDPPGPQPAGLLIEFNYDRPNSKVVGTGIFVAIGPGPLYLELIAPDPDFPAFKHCPRLATG